MGRTAHTSDTISRLIKPEWAVSQEEQHSRTIISENCVAIHSCAVDSERCWALPRHGMYAFREDLLAAVQPALAQIREDSPHSSENKSFEEHFLTNEPREVSEFLEQHVQVAAGDLEKIAEQIKKRFGRCEIHLSVIREPNSLETCQLGILISTRMRASDSWDLLQKLDEEWWIDHPLSATGLIVIDVE